MRPSLRNKYFGWLLFLIGLIFVMIITAHVAVEVHEAHTQGSPLLDEWPEILAMLGVLVLAAPAAVIVAWSIAGRLLSPLQHILATADSIRLGNLSERVPRLARDDELSRLAAAVNGAFDRYESTVTRMEHFSADASHQLRTPLAAIRTTAEVNLQGRQSPEDYREALGSILEQTDKLNQTIDQLLMLARLHPDDHQAFALLDLDELLGQWTQEASLVFEDRRLEHQSEAATASRRIYGNETLLHEVFQNLINNAVYFTREGSRIIVRTGMGPEGRMTWWTEDDGPGIPREERLRIFDRFYRTPGSASKGAGLGLALVREIISLHQGDVQAVDPVVLAGAAIRITLPLAEPVVPG